ncbi:monosaccharide ABC transporter substrate-binding protein, CUT2 family [Nakamurella panacisegetis]|uniref:Monosaccharide ABC transporter substrate-binding protein, CUT2 family n=1 Tax=Nakamurella panacisegetis TaxID=1090615 RepID=A0A1H0M628_9ACTN|nr:substrate-binding domain-containing protein [Nakamurella panacisegetis]SDO75962.1 monosaccharide ABC transporter substrate-binding protein, CUT2 family [Nakamurella panacisegetis]
MRLKTSAALGLMMAGTLVVAACSSSSSSTSSSASSATSAASSAAAGSSSAGSSVASSAAVGSSSAAGSSSSGPVKGKVGVILPDTKSSARWATADAPLLTAAFKAAGIPADIQNAQGSATQMATIADQMIAGGVTVLAIVNLDNASGAAIEKKAATQGVKTLDYDRLTLGGSASAYISFDNVKVGELQGQGLATCLGSGNKNIIFLDGSPTDSNATDFAKGAHNILDKITSYKKVGEQAVKDWDNQIAATDFEQLFTAAGGKVDGVLAANDGLGNAAISILKKNNLKIPVTGQDATVQGMQNILDGYQCMSVYKPVKQEAAALAAAAIALAKGGSPATTGTITDSQTKKAVPAVLLTPVAITKSNISVPIKDGYLKLSDVCTAAYQAKCTAAGVTG